MSELTGVLSNSTTNAAPKITPYLPDPEKSTGIGIIIFPGGGYGGHAEHEGKGYAEFFQKEGIAGFVVSYRLGPQGHKHPAMVEDALAAINAVRMRAAEFHLNPDKIGVMGSSAGGHLTAHSLIAWKKYGNAAELRPSFGILCYPVIAMDGEFCHAGSRTNLLGSNPSEDLKREVCCDQHVSAETPPCFLWHTWDDAVVPVENSMMFASALRKNKVSFEMHIYPEGPHGLGLNTELPWGRDCLRWLKEINA